eukprot:gnl/Dysnectes_brevis/2494_a2982_806.p1 GENE.gnl/Dysnectes_brevis/2494_a2982_806~~gnl/Dysnectes_brevis/2494_a2982_806.p1  ORF type:complete len:388 (+),score=132.25 gnl/Dysnectes_brevis/2494_a2982_806:803-1966(+)
MRGMPGIPRRVSPAQQQQPAGRPPSWTAAPAASPSTPGSDMGLLAQDIVGFTSTYKGSRKAQAILSSAADQGDIEGLTLIATAVITADVFTKLATNSFGNYVAQQLLEVLPDTTVLINVILRGANVLSFHQFGCRVVQRALKVLPDPFAHRLLEEVMPRVMSAVKDRSANHVLQRLVERLGSGPIRAALAPALRAPLSLALHQHACRVMQRIIAQGGKDVQGLVNLLTPHAARLSESAHGNFVCQAVLSNPRIDRVPFVDQLTANVGHLCTLKYASNVVECLLKECPASIVNAVVPIMLRDPAFPSLVWDKYGNYVVQTLLKMWAGASQTVPRVCKWVLNNNTIPPDMLQYVNKYMRKLCPSFPRLDPLDPRDVSASSYDDVEDIES